MEKIRKIKRRVIQMDNVEKLHRILNIDENRANELLDGVFRIASEVWKAKEGLLIVDRAKDLLSLAKTKEEAYFVGMVAAMINVDMWMAVNPIPMLAECTETISILEEYCKEEQDHASG